MFCFGNEATVLCSVSKTCGPGSCGCCSGLPIQLHSVFRVFHQIRMHSAAENHPRAEISSNQDAFLLQKASLFGKIRCQGLFSRGECIPIRKNSSPGIIFPRRMHPYSEKFVTRDYCFMENASLTSYFVESGCIPPSKCIPDRVFHQIRMHSSGK